MNIALRDRRRPAAAPTFVDLTFDDLSEHAVRTVEQRLVDSVGCGLGVFRPAARRQRSLYAAAGPGGGATILGTGMRTTPRTRCPVTPSSRSGVLRQRALGSGSHMREHLRRCGGGIA